MQFNAKQYIHVMHGYLVPSLRANTVVHGLIGFDRGGLLLGCAWCVKTPDQCMELWKQRQDDLPVSRNLQCRRHLC